MRELGGTFYKTDREQHSFLTNVPGEMKQRVRGKTRGTETEDERL